MGNGDDDRIYYKGLLWGLNELLYMKSLKQCQTHSKHYLLINLSFTLALVGVSSKIELSSFLGLDKCWVEIAAIKIIHQFIDFSVAGSSQ